MLTLESGKTLLVDEKVRDKDWPDILLEYWSNYEKRVPGWVAKDLACDFIAYAFIPSATCYLLQFQMLRKAWRENYREWVEKYPKVEAMNRNYTTVSVAVPTEVLLASMSDSVKVCWREKMQ